MTTIAVISSGLREPSSTRLLADRLAMAVRAELSEPGLELPVIELRHHGRAIMDAMLTGYPSAELREAFDTVAGADGLIAVTPAFNASFSGLFKSFFDVLPLPSLQDMPVLIGATGGTERHSLVLEHALRPMFSYLHAVVSPMAVYAATDDFAGTGTDSLEIFPGWQVSSTFADGAITHYVPRWPEWLLGIGGLSAAFLLTVIGVRVLDFMPQDDLAAAH